MKFLKSLLLAVLLGFVVTSIILANTFFPPQVSIDNSSGLQAAPGSYFYSPLQFGSSPVTGTLGIVDNQGAYVVSRELGLGEAANDFKMLPTLAGSSRLMSYRIGDCFEVVNRDFEPVSEYCAGGDYAGERVDFHDFQLDSQGDGWIMLYRSESADLSPYGGPVTGTIEMSVIQQIERDTGAVLWQIRSDDWLTLDDATVPMTRTYVQPYHINSYDLCDNETTILISSRNVDEIVKIRLEDKTILWRLGGKNATVAPSDGVQNYKQHDARCVDDGNLISIFDNGDMDLRPYSRAVVYDIDQAAGAATLMFEYRHMPDIFARFTGNFQYLTNVDRGIIHWGGAAFDDPELPNVTEIRLSDQSVVQEIFLPNNMISYRITKHFYGIFDLYLPLIKN